MIKEFRGEYKWLSNFAPCDIYFDGRWFASAEHAYMSAKSTDVAWKEFCADPDNRPGEVKRKSRTIVLREDWELVKLAVMREVLELKFAQEPYRTYLVNTGSMVIQEGNRWGDTFWGVDLKTNTGENNLGKLIMAIRAQLREAEPKEKLHHRVAKKVRGFIRRLLPG